jgi:hypothetical protein
VDAPPSFRGSVPVIPEIETRASMGALGVIASTAMRDLAGELAPAAIGRPVDASERMAEDGP